MSKIRLARLEDAKVLSRLTYSLSSYISDKGLSEAFQKSFTVEAFQKSISNEKWFTTLVYEEDETIIAYISLVNNSHIYHLFVEKTFHKKGIAKQLWHCVLSESPAVDFTVNASLYSVPFYVKLGFVPSENEQVSMGVRYQPMFFKS